MARDPKPSETGSAENSPRSNLWPKKGSVAPRPHGQRSLMVKPQRAAASQPSSLAATLVTLPEPEGTGNVPGGDPN